MAREKKFTRSEVLDSLSENEIIDLARGCGLGVQTPEEQEARFQREREATARRLRRQQADSRLHADLLTSLLEAQAEADVAAEANHSSFSVGIAGNDEDDEKRVSVKIVQSNNNGLLHSETMLVLSPAETLDFILSLDTAASTILLETHPEQTEDRILLLRRQYGVTLDEVADRLRISREEVRQMEQRAIRRERGREQHPSSYVADGDDAAVVEAYAKGNPDGTLTWVEGGDDLPPEVRNLIEDIARGIGASIPGAE